MRLSPQDPYSGQFLLRRAEAYLFLGRLEEAVELAELVARANQTSNGLAGQYWLPLQAHLGRLEEALRSIEA